MIPLFKSHASIGRSILTLDDPKKQTKYGAKSIVSLAEEAGLKEVFLVEDSMIGFLDAWKQFKPKNIKLCFGVRISCKNSFSDEDKSFHKIVIFAKNDSGIKSLNKIYSHANVTCKGFIDFVELKKFWNESLILGIPFYDSFIYCNNLSFSNFVPDFSGIDEVVFFKENNLLPTDIIVSQKVDSFCESYNYQTIPAKSIYYENREDYDAYITYKLCTSRSSFSGKETSLQCPNLDHCGSREFCWESFKENV